MNISRALKMFNFFAPFGCCEIANIENQSKNHVFYLMFAKQNLSWASEA